MPTKEHSIQADDQPANQPGSFSQPTNSEEREERKRQPPEEGGKLVWVPRSVLPYIRSTLDWCGVVVSYPRKQGNSKGRCVGHVLDVRLTRNGNTQMLINCHEHSRHKPIWKHSRFIDDWPT